MKYYFILFFIVLPIYLIAQDQYNHPEIKWQTIETEHFKIHFYSDTEILAREAVVVLDYIYPIITELYQHEPAEKTHVIFTDTEDIGNGAAYYYDNKIKIWASPLDIALRGSHKWLENVLTHEFTHIISIQKAMKTGTSIPGAYFQWIGYEEETHKNVLYGYPNIMISYPLPATVVPPWLAEGMAQYMYADADWDNWDSHRDMILRDQALNDKLLSFEEINTFGKTGIGNESVYNSGFAFVNYIVNKFGEETLLKIMSELSNPFQYSIDKVIKKATGIGGKKLYKNYLAELKNKYHQATDTIFEDKNIIMLQNEGSTNIYPKWSNSGDQYAYLSNKGNDYFSQTDLYIYNFKTGEDKKITAGVQSAPTWEANDYRIFYSKKQIVGDFKGYHYFDLYVYDIKKDKETRLTKSSRGVSPIYIEYLNSIAFIAMDGGKQSIFIYSLDSEKVERIKTFNESRILHNLFFDKDKKRILFDYTFNHYRNIASLSLDDRQVTNVISTLDNDERDVCITNDGELLFSTDINGIFNIVKYDTLNVKNYTNVKGGAFMPDVSKAGKLIFSLYQNGGYKIAIIDTPKVISSIIFSDIDDSKYQAPVNSPDNKVAAKYHDNFAKMFLMPRLMVDYGTVKPGFYFSSSEILEKLSLNGGVTVNFDKDIDFSFNLAYRKLFPTVYTEFMFATRNTVEKSKYSVYDIDDRLRFRFVLMRAGLQFPFFGQDVIDVYVQWQRYRAFIKESIANLSSDIGYAYDYYRGIVTGVNFGWDNIKRTADRNINPSKGYKFNINISYELNDFIEGLNLSDSGTLIEEFAPNNYYKIDAISSFHTTILPSKRWTLNYSAKIGWLSNSSVESFFNYFGGGIDGIQGYPFYSFEGTNSVFSEFALRIPIFRNVHIPLGWMIWQNSTLGIEYQFGDTWSDEFNMKQSLGMQLRFNGFSFYNYPTALGIEIHRGLTNFTIFDNDDKIDYGNENHIYLTLLFGF
ncbi:MAG: hypothetical protein V3R52_01590 [Candidatus Neomarinimicrobiota bacterium]